MPPSPHVLQLMLACDECVMYRKYGIIVALTAPEVKNEVITAVFPMVRRPARSQVRGISGSRNFVPETQLVLCTEVTMQAVSLRGLFWSCGGKARHMSSSGFH